VLFCLGSRPYFRQFHLQLAVLASFLYAILRYDPVVSSLFPVPVAVSCVFSLGPVPELGVLMAAG
jgi:hypothetical protein